MISYESMKPAKAPADRDYYTVPEVAEALHVGVATVWRWVSSGKLDAYRVGSRNIRVPKAALASVVTSARKRKAVVVPWEIAAFAPPSPEQLARRQAVVESILKRTEGRSIAPLTTADLVRQVREEQEAKYRRSD